MKNKIKLMLLTVLAAFLWQAQARMAMLPGARMMSDSIQTDSIIIADSIATDSVVVSDSIRTDSVVVSDSIKTDSVVVSDSIRTDSVVVSDTIKTDTVVVSDSIKTDSVVVTDSIKTDSIIVSDSIRTDSVVVSDSIKTDSIAVIDSTLTDSISSFERICYLYIPDTLTRQGESLSLPICLKNNVEICGIQFDIVLPDGITIELDSAGTPQSELTERTQGMTISSKDRGNGRYRFVMYSLSGGCLNGTDSAIVILPLVVSDDAASDVQNIKLSNVVLTTDDLESIHADEATSTITVKANMLGDVNRDDVIDVTDIILLNARVQGKETDIFYEDVADMNADGRLNITDVVILADLVLDADVVIGSNDEPISLRVCQWNVGHYSYNGDGTSSGTASSTRIPLAEYENYVSLYSSYIQSIDADILGVCEDNTYFTAGDSYHPTKKVLYSKLFSDMYLGKDMGWTMNSLYGNLDGLGTVEGSGEVEYETHTTHAYRSYVYWNLDIQGHNVKVAETHLEVNFNGENMEEYRKAEMQELINTFADEDYVIIMGDFNAHSSEFAQLEEAGYTIANASDVNASNSYITCSRTTYFAEGWGRLDQIAVKGFKMSDVEVHKYVTKDDKTMDIADMSGEGYTVSLSDHYAISCKLTMQKK